MNIQHLFSGAVPDNEREAILHAVQDVVRTADYVICTQAGVTPLTLEFLTSCGRTDTHVNKLLWLNKSLRLKTSVLRKKLIRIRMSNGIRKDDPNFKFRYADFKKAWWYYFECNNRDAVNGSDWELG